MVGSISGVYANPVSRNSEYGHGTHTHVHTCAYTYGLLLDPRKFFLFPYIPTIRQLVTSDNITRNIKYFDGKGSDHNNTHWVTRKDGHRFKIINLLNCNEGLGV